MNRELISSKMKSSDDMTTNHKVHKIKSVLSGLKTNMVIAQGKEF